MNPLPFIIARDPGQQHRRHGDADRRPAEHPDRLSAAGIDFATFAANMAPAGADHPGDLPAAARWMFRGQLESIRRCVTALLALDEREMIADPRLLREVAGGAGSDAGRLPAARTARLEPATVALTGAVALMIVAREDPHEVLREVEWPTLFFFIGLFMLVAGVIEIGVIEAIATGSGRRHRRRTGGRHDPALVAVGGASRRSSTTSPTRPP